MNSRYMVFAWIPDSTNTARMNIYELVDGTRPTDDVCFQLADSLGRTQFSYRIGTRAGVRLDSFSPEYRCHLSKARGWVAERLESVEVSS